jgi:hypothetical protein
LNVSAHVNKYYAKHRRRGDQESATKTEEDKLEDQESQQVYVGLRPCSALPIFAKNYRLFGPISCDFSLLIIVLQFLGLAQKKYIVSKFLS